MSDLKFRTQLRVVRFNHWISSSFAQSLKREAAISLDVVDLACDEDLAWDRLARAQVYQITPAINELPPQYRVTKEFLGRCPGLLCVSSGGAGYDTVDVAACTAAGVAVVSQIGGNAVSVAEMTIGLMLAVSRRIVESDRLLRAERGFSRESLMGREISGKTLGIVGMGHAGTQTARLAKAFGMRILACDPLLDSEVISERGAQSAELDELVAQSDFVSLHCPRDSSTIGLFDRRRFSSMKKGAIFISTARGDIHNEQALAEALTSGQLGGAGLDVWSAEPPPLSHPLLSLPNVVATFHTAGVSHEGRANVARMSAEQIAGLLHGKLPPRLVNPEVRGQFARRFEAALGVALV